MILKISKLIKKKKNIQQTLENIEKKELLKKIESIILVILNDLLICKT